MPICLKTRSAANIPAAVPFPLGDVKLLDSPFAQNSERNARYLLALEPDRFLHNARKYAGLAPRAEVYGGWESKGIAGHTLGHYLTALSLHYAATGDTRFKERLDYTIAEMAACQRAYGDGYVGALPPNELATLRGFASGKVELNGSFSFSSGAWVPWYTQHKILQGLIDAWTLGGSDEARDVALGFAAFTDQVTRAFTPADLQRMLGVEHGGMLDALVQLAQLTGDERWLAVARRFYHQAVLDPLDEGRDPLDGLHANTQIPKVVGQARDHEATGDERGRRIAEHFWNIVVHRRSWVIGGNSDKEHFFPVGDAHKHLGPLTAETCNTYNLLKLTRHLFGWEPSVEKADFYERALYNHILGSQDPEQGMFTYFMSLKPGHHKVYSRPFDSFWCCVGSGMENHAKYGDSIYFHGADDLYVNLFIPSELTWRERSLVLAQTTRFPREAATTLTVHAAPSAPLALKIRCPRWLAAPPVFTLNGQPLALDARPGEFAVVSRIWSAGDTLHVTLPMSLRTETLEDRPHKIAFLYGPLVLAGDLGPAPRSWLLDQRDRANDPGAPVPLLVHDGASDLAAKFAPDADDPLCFRSSGLACPDEITLRPFAELPFNHYNLYWDVVAPAEWTAIHARLEAELAQNRAEAARLVDQIVFGEQQPEVDHDLVAERSETGSRIDRNWRDAGPGGHLEFRLKTSPGTPQLLRFVCSGDDADRAFDIVVEGRLLTTRTLDREKPGGLVTIDCPLPEEAVRHGTILVRFAAHADRRTGSFFNCSVVKPAP